MLRFILKRLVYGFLVLLGVTTIVFVLFHILPGDPARLMMGQRADISSVENIRRELGLDLPLHLQYLHFLNDLSPVSIHDSDPESRIFLDAEKYRPFLKVANAGGSFLVVKAPYLRQSYQSKRDVSDIIADAFPMTLLLASAAMLFALLVGVTLGALSAVYRDGWFDRAAMVVSPLRGG